MWCFLRAAPDHEYNKVSCPFSPPSFALWSSRPRQRPGETEAWNAWTTSSPHQASQVLRSLGFSRTGGPELKENGTLPVANTAPSVGEQSAQSETFPEDASSGNPVPKQLVSRPESQQVGSVPRPHPAQYNTRLQRRSQRASYTVLNFCSELPEEAPGKRACGEQETWALGLPGPALHSRGPLPPSPVTGCEDQTGRGLQAEFELTL